MDTTWKTILWRQLGAALDMLENAVRACPEAVWSDRSRQPEYWYVVYHTLFFLDLTAYGSVEGFLPPPPFNLDELDPAGILPPRPYTQDELLAYLEHGRRKSREAIEAMTAEKAQRPCKFGWMGTLSEGDVLLQSLRHVQHHTAQLNLILRQTTGSAPRWVAATASGLDGAQG